jgi:hypothetical protein
MSRKSTLLIAVAAVLAGMSMAGASFYSAHSVPVTTAAIVAQAVPAQVGALVDAGPSENFGTPIHVTVAGAGPMSGSFTAYECRTDGSGRLWKVRLVSPANRGIQGLVLINRFVNPDASVTWYAEAGCGPAGGFGAHAGSNAPHGTQAGYIPLNGPDFHGSGSMAFVGSPAFGGGGNVTISVSP